MVSGQHVVYFAFIESTFPIKVINHQCTWIAHIGKLKMLALIYPYKHDLILMSHKLVRYYCSYPRRQTQQANQHALIKYMHQITYCTTHRDILFQSPLGKDAIEFRPKLPLCQDGKHHTFHDRKFSSLQNANTRYLTNECILHLQHQR